MINQTVEVKDCEYCDCTYGTRRKNGVFMCSDCYEDWLSGAFDQDPPEEDDS